MERERRERGWRIERKNMSKEAFFLFFLFCRGSRSWRGSNRYALDGLTKGEIWLLNLTLIPSN